MIIGLVGNAVDVPGIGVGNSEVSLSGILAGWVPVGLEVVTNEGGDVGMSKIDVSDGEVEAEREVDWREGRDVGVVADEAVIVTFELAVVVKLADEDEVGGILGCNVGEDVGDTVGVDDGDEVGGVLGCNVGEDVGDTVGVDDGDEVGGILGCNVGEDVGDTVGVDDGD